MEHQLQELHAGTEEQAEEAKGELPAGADIIVVKISFAITTEVMRAIKYVIDKAEAQDMPVAINLSIGTNNGAHNGASLFETYIDEMSAKWKTVIVVASRKRRVWRTSLRRTN